MVIGSSRFQARFFSSLLVRAGLVELEV